MLRSQLAYRLDFLSRTTSDFKIYSVDQVERKELSVMRQM